MMEEGRSLSDMLPRCTEHGLYKPLQKTYSNLECYHSNGEADNIYNYPGMYTHCSRKSFNFSNVD